jgi:hypothetical protein
MMMEIDSGIKTVVKTVKALLQTGQFSDLTLVCRDEQIFVHRGIVCSRSPVWAAAIEGKFKVRMKVEFLCSRAHMDAGSRYEKNHGRRCRCIHR